MHTIGIIGGLGPETTIVYYRHFVAAGHRRVVINSVDSDVLVPLATGGDWQGVTDFLVPEVERLAAAGADVALIAANTPHACFDAIQARVAVPLVSIVEAVAAHCVQRGFRRAALFGTRMTMEATFFPEVFSRHGVALVLPNKDEQTYIHDRYMNELFKGVIKPETRRGLLAVVDAVAAREEIDAVILGGTELSLILTDDQHNDIPLVDTTRVHVDAALARLGGGGEGL